MKSLLGLLLATALAPFSAHAAHTQARLILSAETARPGDTVMGGIHLKMDPGWHTYFGSFPPNGRCTTPLTGSCQKVSPLGKSNGRCPRNRPNWSSRLTIMKKKSFCLCNSNLRPTYR